MKAESNIPYAERAHPNWRLTMPVLFLHGAYHYTCKTTPLSPGRADAPIAPT
jgi:hypothetical protein